MVLDPLYRQAAGARYAKAPVAGAAGASFGTEFNIPTLSQEQGAFKQKRQIQI